MYKQKLANFSLVVIIRNLTFFLSVNIRFQTERACSVLLRNKISWFADKRKWFFVYFIRQVK